MQELIWRVRPNLIIETGIAHGGWLIFMDPAKSNRKVLGIDIDLRAHNRAAIEAHPMASRIQMIQGSSIAPRRWRRCTRSLHLEEVATIVERNLGTDEFVEVGCGKAYFLELLQSRGCSITGFDPTYEGDYFRFYADVRPGGGERALVRWSVPHMSSLTSSP